VKKDEEQKRTSKMKVVETGLVSLEMIVDLEPLVVLVESSELLEEGEILSRVLSEAKNERNV